MEKDRKIYLAAPWFRPNERNLYQTIAKAIRKKGYSVYVPMEHPIKDGWRMENWEWGQRVFDEDIQAIRECDEVWVINYGLYSDSGTAWECGYAYALGKEVTMFVNDMDKDKEYSLMMINGCNRVEGLSYLITGEYPKLIDIEVK